MGGVKREHPELVNLVKLADFFPFHRKEMQKGERSRLGRCAFTSHYAMLPSYEAPASCLFARGQLSLSGLSRQPTTPKSRMDKKLEKCSHAQETRHKETLRNCSRPTCRWMRSRWWERGSWLAWSLRYRLEPCVNLGRTIKSNWTASSRPSKVAV